MSRKKNLVFIFTDQQRFDTLHVYGNEKLQMPNLNKLSEESAVFKRTYVTQPVCTPSRGTIMTGLYPHNHESVENNTPLKDEAYTIPELIAGSGYKSAYIGKWHLGNEVIKQHGFDEWISAEDNYSKYYTDEEYKKVLSNYHYFLKENGFNPDNIKDDGVDKFSRDFCTRIPEQYSKPAFIAKEADRFITENKDHPFVAYVSILEPHPPYFSAFDDLYNPDEVDLPPLYHDQIPENAPLKYQYSRIHYRNVGRGTPMMDDEKKWRKLIARYWGACTLIDKYVGQVLDSIKRNGLEDDTIIVFTSDHGDMMGDYRMLQKYVMYESATRVPLLIKAPGMEGQKIIEKPVSQVDLVPTLLELMGHSTDRKLDGKSLAPVLRGDAELKDNDVFIEWNGEEGEDLWFRAYRDGELKERIDRIYGAAVRTVVTSDCWKLSLTEAGENELYDLNTDPHERMNLYFDERFSEQKQRLTRKILEWQAITNDNVELAVSS